MKFENDKSSAVFGEKIGYGFGYAVFTSVLFFVLRYFDKLPEGWGAANIAAATLAVTIIGLIAKKVLS